MARMLVIVTIAFASLLAACGGPSAAAQQVLTSSGRALVAFDREVAPRYAQAADEAREHSSDWASYDASMRGWNDLETALRGSHAAMLAAQAGIDAWRAGQGEAGWLAAVPCLVAALEHLYTLTVTVAPTLRLDPLAEALSLARPFAGACEAQP